jgi:nicotinamidase-related amidase
MPNRAALLLIDVLAGAFRGPPFRTWNGEPVLPNVQRLLARARDAGALVVHVVEAFDETKYPPGSPVWNAYQVHPDVAPLAGEPIVRQQRFDAFLGNDLHERLTSAGAATVVIAGLSSPWCVDTAVRRAFGLGYRVVLAADAHGCADGKTFTGPEIARHHNEILAACFAEVTPVDEVTF